MPSNRPARLFSPVWHCCLVPRFRRPPRARMRHRQNRPPLPRLRPRAPRVESKPAEAAATPPQRSTASPTGSSCISRSIPPPGSTKAAGRPCSSNGRRWCIGSSALPGSSRSPARPARWPAATSRRSRPTSFATFDPAFDKIWLVRILGPVDRGPAFHRPRIRHGHPLAGTAPGAQGVRAGRRPPGLAPVRSRALQPHRPDHRPGRGTSPAHGPGASITPASRPRAASSQGNGLLPAPPGLHEATNRSSIRRILFTYLQVEEVKGPVARCAIVSACAIR